MTALRPADGCPGDACVSLKQAPPPVEPYSAGWDGVTADGIVARYRCPRCGHRWRTFWDTRYIGLLDAAESQGGAA